jgi:hypothetical protein
MYLILYGIDKQSCIISIKRDSAVGRARPDRAENAASGSHLKNALHRVNGEDEQHGGQGIPLLKAPRVRERPPRLTV